MARRRYVSPGFWDGALARRVGIGARLLLVACWTMADDQGRLRWQPALLRETIFPGDRDVTDAMVAQWMGELESAGAVYPYRGGRGGLDCGYIVGFEEAHRTARPRSSTLPAPSETGLAEFLTTTTSHGTHDELTERGTAGLTESRTAAFSEPGTAGLTEPVVSAAVPGSLSGVPGTAEAGTPPLTCNDAVMADRDGRLSEPVVSRCGGLTEASPTEREKEGEREMEREEDPLSAPRSNRTPLEAGHEAAEAAPTACGEAATPPPAPTQQEPATAPPSVRHLSAVPDDVADDARVGGSGRDDLSGADGVLDEPEAPNRSQGLAVSETTQAGDAMSHDDTQDALFDVPAPKASPAPETKRKRKSPATWTPDRKQQAHDILKPWWDKHGTGWPQSYGVVFGVIVAALANKMTAEDIARAMETLGTERKPISGGTIAFALTTPTRQAAEQRAFERADKYRSAETYTQRTL